LVSFKSGATRGSCHRTLFLPLDSLPLLTTALHHRCPLCAAETQQVEKAALLDDVLWEEAEFIQSLASSEVD
jgi:hypothetical protein